MARPKGTPQSAEWRKAQSERMRKYWANKKRRAAQSAKLKASWSDPELRKRQSEMVKQKHAEDPGRWTKSEETRRRISRALTGKPHPHTKEQDAKIAEANRGKKRSAKTCERISAAKKGQEYRPRSEEHTANQSKAQTGQSKKCGPAVSAFRKEYDKTPEGRERLRKHSESMKKWHKDHPDESAAMMDTAQAANPKWRDTKPELQTVEILNGLGLRYEKQYRASWMPKGYRNHKWDFKVAGEHVLIEVDGCYFHGCPEHTSEARRAELAESASKELNRDVEAELFDWTVLRFWEHELNDAPGDVARCVTDAVEHRRKLAAA